MFLIKVGDVEKNDSKPLEQKGQSNDFEQAKKKANKLLEKYTQVEIIDSATDQCVHYQSRENDLLPQALENNHQKPAL